MIGSPRSLAIRHSLAHLAFRPVGHLLVMPIEVFAMCLVPPDKQGCILATTLAGGQSRPRTGQSAPDDRLPVTQSDRRRPVCPWPFDHVLELHRRG